MNQNSIARWISASALAISLAVGAITLPASAQTSPAPGPGNTESVQQNNAPNLDTTPFQETKGKADNYGWLGLFGLLGLLNLLRKPETRTAYRDPNVVTSQPSER